MKKISNKEIPNEPGIYIFKDNYEEPLYVGKAKNLRKRVPSYFAKQTSWKIKRLISEANEISFVVAKNEADALLADTHSYKNINQNIMFSLKMINHTHM
tara:strand:- start:134 stop:430 length:297 start_codon:yes stop_codon:yes gene_type:complete